MRTDGGPSPVWAILTSAVGTVLCLAELNRLVLLEVPAGEVRNLSVLLLTASLALSGYSLVTVLSHALVARRWKTRGAVVVEPPIRLRGGHSLHAIWVVGVGGALALMGLLGLWSWADGRTSGLEPGWHLLLAGGALAGLGFGVSRWIDRRWQQVEELAASSRLTGARSD